MNKAKRKLILSGLSLLMAVVIMATASLAWYTISTNPEVKGLSVTMYTKQSLLLSTDNETFTRTIDLSEAFENYITELRPVSTIDGVHWYIPAYDETGALMDASEFELDDTLYHANVYKYVLDKDNNLVLKNGEPVERSGEDLNDAKSQAYYLYTDFWVKSETEDGTKVRLSIPNNLSKSQEDEDLDNHYGTYAMAWYSYDTQTSELEDISYDAQTALRIGFLIYGNGENNAPTRFVIYEPNATSRSSGTKPSDDLGKYIVDYVYDADDYVEGNYIKTYPIGYKENGKTRYTYSGSTIPTLYIYDTESSTYEAIDEYNLNDSKSNTVQYYTRNYVGEKGFLPTFYLKDEVEEGEPQTYTETSYTFGSQSTTNYYVVDSDAEDGYSQYDFSSMKSYYVYKNKVYTLITSSTNEVYNPNVTYYYRQYSSWDYAGEDIPKLYTKGTLQSDGEYSYTEVTSYNLKDNTYYMDGAQGEVQSIPQGTLIVQEESTWDTEKLEDELKKESPEVNSSCISSLGKFYDVTDLYSGDYANERVVPDVANADDVETDISGDTLILTLTDDTPVKIRLFIWIEGQDVDCYNDIAAGTFFINLELAGEDD